MASFHFQPRSRDDFKVAVICALPLEADLVYKVFNKSWTREGIDFGKAQGDQNAYTLGVIGKHNVVLVHMPGTGTVSAAAVSGGIRSSFTQIEVAFVVGICGASPVHPETQERVKLGDCIFSTTVIEYDFGKQHGDQFVRKSDVEEVHGRANPTIRALLNQLKVSSIRQDLANTLNGNLESLQVATAQAAPPKVRANQLGQIAGLQVSHHHSSSDANSSQAVMLYDSVTHRLGSSDHAAQPSSVAGITAADHGKPQIHFGRIGSASTVVKSSNHRDKLSDQDKIVGFEMESAGVWDNLPTIVLKSACDYADENKNDVWQPYAAATAAAALKAVLEYLSKTDTRRSSPQLAVNIPNHAVAHFIQRLDILRELNSWLLDNVQQEKVILLGMGGAGKSQLALECCRKAVASGQFTTVLWFHASSVSSIEQSLKIIVSKLEGSQAVSLNAKENLAMVEEVLRGRQGAWLAIFDNFDTPSAFGQVPITRYMPEAEHGKILLTSRNAGSDRLGRTIRVSGMSENESLELLLKRPVRDSAERADGIQIAAELGHLALALDQAEAYIRARELPLQEFITHFRQRKKMILSEIPQHWEYRKSQTDGEQDILLSAFTTWELSFEQISGSTEVKRSKEHFLTLCAFFDPTSISKEYFKSYCYSTGRKWTSIFKSEDAWVEFLFDDLAAECRTLSLLQTVDEHHTQRSLSLHPLIQDWLKLRRTAQEQQQIAQEFTALLVSHENTIDFDTLGQIGRQHLLANITSCLQEDNRFGDVLQYYTNDLVYSAEVFAAIYCASGLYNESEELYKQVLAGNQEQLGAEHPDTLRTMLNLANVYLNKGRYDDAEELLKQVLAGRREQLGAKHPDTLRTMLNLANVYLNKGRYDDAEELLKQVLASRKEQLGAKHPDTLGTMHNLANVYLNKGRYDDAQELYKQVLAGRREQLGAKHPDTLRTMLNLASVYANKGRYDDAEELYKQVLAGRREQLGAKHPDTLGTMLNLASVYANKGRYDDAEELLKQVLAGNQEQLGAKHPETLRTMYNLAILYKKLSNYSAAKRLLTQVLAGREERLGINHPHTKNTREQLASLPWRRRLA